MRKLKLLDVIFLPSNKNDNSWVVGTVVAIRNEQRLYEKLSPKGNEEYVKKTSVTYGVVPGVDPIIERNIQWFSRDKLLTPKELEKVLAGDGELGFMFTGVEDLKP